MIFHLLGKDPISFPSMTEMLKICCWQYLLYPKGPHVGCSSALNTHLELQKLIASFLMGCWVQDKYQIWPLTLDHQIALWRSSSKLEIPVAFPPSFGSNSNSLPFITSNSTEFSFLLVEKHYSSLSFMLNPAFIQPCLQTVEMRGPTSPFPILSPESPQDTELVKPLYLAVQPFWKEKKKKKKKKEELPWFISLNLMDSLRRNEFCQGNVFLMKNVVLCRENTSTPDEFTNWILSPARFQIHEIHAEKKNQDF